MLIKKIAILSFALILAIGFSISTDGYAQTGTTNQENVVLTKEQLKEIEKEKKATENLKNNWNKRSEKVFYGDKTSISKKPVSSEFSTTATYTGRKGVFYITLDGTSSGSLDWAGGHAGIVYDTYNVVESFGNQKDSGLNGVHFWPNDWTTRYNHFEARTTYDTTIEQDAMAADKAATYIGRPYNYFFFYIDQDDSFYCSQLVWYSFIKLFNIDLNDGGAVWPVDLTESPEAYLIYAQ